MGTLWKFEGLLEEFGCEFLCQGKPNALPLHDAAYCMGTGHFITIRLKRQYWQLVKAQILEE